MLCYRGAFGQILQYVTAADDGVDYYYAVMYLEGVTCHRLFAVEDDQYSIDTIRAGSSFSESST